MFSDVDVDAEIRKMERWLSFNRPKKNWTAFVCKWLLRSKSKASVPNDPTVENPGRYREGVERKAPRPIANALIEVQSRNNWPNA